jgi:hypothetical protein
MAAIKTNIGLRQKIVKTFNSLPGESKSKIKLVADKLGLTYWQVYNAVSARVKLDRSNRSDKGLSRKNPEAACLGPSNAKPEEFESLEVFLEHQLTVTARDLSRRKYTPELRVRLLKEITAMKKNLDKQKIEGWISKPEAILLINIMKRLKPNITDDEIKKIYSEEYEKIQRDLN